MKNKLLIIALTILSVVPILAQQKAGTFSITPRVGATLSYLTGNPSASFTYYIIPMELENFPDNVSVVDAGNNWSGRYHFSDCKSKFDITFGVEGHYQFTSVFGLSLGVFYTREGVRYKTIGRVFDIKPSESSTYSARFDLKDDPRTNLNCIVAPVLVNVYVWRGLALKAGLQPEFSVSKKTQGDVDITYKGYSEAYFDHDTSLRSFAFSLPLGVSYEYDQFVADLRYCFGITDLNKNTGSKKNYSVESVYNRVLSFTIGYKFQFGK